jgi:hypothetical protein
MADKSTYGPVLEWLEKALIIIANVVIIGVIAMICMMIYWMFHHA